MRMANEKSHSLCCAQRPRTAPRAICMLYASMHNIEGDGTSGQKAAGTSGSGQRAARTKVAAWSYCVRDGADESQELRSSKTDWAPGKSDEHPERVEANLGLLKDHSATPDHEEKRAVSDSNRQQAARAGREEHDI